MATILIIDDNKEFRAALRTLLETEGHSVREAPDGVAGIDAYRKRAVDLVFCDIIMPEKEGLETIRDLHKMNKEVKIIAISGYPGEEREDFLNAAGVFGAAKALQKPFTSDELFKAVHEMLGTAS